MAFIDLLKVFKKKQSSVIFRLRIISFFKMQANIVGPIFIKNYLSL